MSIKIWQGQSKWIHILLSITEAHVKQQQKTFLECSLTIQSIKNVFWLDYASLQRELTIFRQEIIKYSLSRKLNDWFHHNLRSFIPRSSKIPQKIFTTTMNKIQLNIYSHQRSLDKQFAHHSDEDLWRKLQPLWQWFWMHGYVLQKHINYSYSY